MSATSRYIRTSIVCLVLLLLVMLAGLAAIFTGETAIRKKQKAPVETMHRILELSAKKAELVYSVNSLPADVRPLPVFLSGDPVPPAGELEAWHAGCDSLFHSIVIQLKKTDPAEAVKLGVTYTELTHGLDTLSKDYNELVRQSNHFMKVFPNNFFSALFNISSLPEYRHGNEYLNKIYYLINDN